MEFKPTDLPIEKTLPKLIRDRIPEIMKKRDANPVISVCSDEKEYLQYVLKKLGEEMNEVQLYKNYDNLLEELADVKELTLELMKLMNIQETDIERVRLLKNEKNGPFKKRYILEEINDKSTRKL